MRLYGAEPIWLSRPAADAVEQKYGVTFQRTHANVGGAGIDNEGKALPQTTIDICTASDAILFGSVGGPKWEKLPPAEQPERASLLPLRKHFTLYANVRPGLLLKNLIDTSPIRPDRIPNGVDMVCIRELTGGLYFGKPKETTTLPDGDVQAVDTMVYRRSEIERITATDETNRLCSQADASGKPLDEATAKVLSRMVYGIVCFATLFSFVGTVLGGIWADQSWGRFWGWDPKENGALIIVIWNALILHARWGGMIKARGLMCLAVAGNIFTSASWFGTNMLGIGLRVDKANDISKQRGITQIAIEFDNYGLKFVRQARGNEFVEISSQRKDSTAQQVMNLVRTLGKADAGSIAESIGVDRSTVSSILQNPEYFKAVGKDGRKVVYSIRDSVNELLGITYPNTSFDDETISNTHNNNEVVVLEGQQELLKTENTQQNEVLDSKEYRVPTPTVLHNDEEDDERLF